MRARSKSTYSGGCKPTMFCTPRCKQAQNGSFEANKIRQKADFGKGIFYVHPHLLRTPITVEQTKINGMLDLNVGLPHPVQMDPNYAMFVLDRV